MSEFALLVVVGFLAQMVDGVLGMAYGVTSTTLMLTLGLPPAVASATAHAAEVVTTGASAASHYGFGNVDRQLVKRLLIPGIVGAILGAYVLVNLPGERMRPIIAGYLLIMGVIILIKAWKRAVPAAVATHTSILGFVGAFCDAIGGGGWGPIVTGTLLARGNEPRTTIGSVNFSEFFVTVAASATFFLTIGLKHWTAIVALAIGGVVAAPLAAWATGRIPRKPLMVTVGLLVIALSLRTIVMTFR